MLSEDTIRYISELINGDVEEIYSYKSGSMLVRFFNKYFGYNDEYVSGFPSRWLYTYNKIVELINVNKFDKLINIILDKRYIMRDLNVNSIDALEHEKLILNKLNEKLLYDNFYIQKSNGEYKLLDKDSDLEWIGGGGFAEIYLQKSTNKIVKKLKEDFFTDKGIRSRFKSEYNITKSLNDLSSIIKVYDFDEDNCTYTMERAEKSLDSYIIDNELIDNQKIACIYQILDIMQEVHNREIIHRDISPNNILIMNGILKMADFGLGKDLNIFTSHQTLNTNSVGQYYYCAPEQFMLLSSSDFRSDVYSLGRVINFIMTKNPTKSNHFLRSVTEKATSNNVKFRYANAGELYLAVKQVIKFNNVENRIKNIKTNIENNCINEGVENYLFEISDDVMFENIVYLKNFNEIVLKFMTQDSKKAEYIVNILNTGYENRYRKFGEYDKLAQLTYEIVIGGFEFQVKEIAAKILKYVAYFVNRFYAQELVRNAIDIGLEPMLEDILHK